LYGASEWDPGRQTQLQVVELLSLLHVLIDELQSLRIRVCSCVLKPSRS
jgi:hypothetical protein